MNDTPIRSDEMYELFGDFMPPEAIRLIWDTSSDTTVGEVRQRLRAMASNNITMFAARIEQAETIEIHMGGREPATRISATGRSWIIEGLKLLAHARGNSLPPEDKAVIDRWLALGREM